MKRIFTQAKAMFIALVAVLALASCNSDQQLAYDLDGVWQGSIASEYFSYRFGRTMEYTDAEICFSQRGAWEAGGTGYEIDWYGRSYTKSYFHWSVRNGRIYIDYDDATYTVVVRDFDVYYRGGQRYFNGYFDNEQTGETLAHFDLVKVSSNKYYENRYGYYSRQKGEGEGAETDSTLTEKPANP